LAKVFQKKIQQTCAFAGFLRGSNLLSATEKTCRPWQITWFAGFCFSEITDVPAYNRANGKMWLAYSSVFWLSLILGIFNVSVAGIVLAVGCLGGIPVLVFVYGKIYNKYRR
jgi:hypothetical protein